MKKSITLLLFVFVTNFMFSQFSPTGTLLTTDLFRSGNLGLGYTAAPTFGTNKFMVNGNSFFSGNLTTDTGILTLGSPPPAATNYNIITSKGITLRSSNPPALGLPFTILNSGGYTTLAVAHCNGCFSNFSLTGDSVITGGTGASVGGGSIIIANENNGNIKFETGLINSTTKIQMLIDNKGYVGIGTQVPSEKLEVNGNLKATQGIFTNSLPNGSVFASGSDQNDKCLVFSAGALIGTGPGYKDARLFKFYDFPQSNIISKPVLYISIEDRTDMQRYKFAAETGGTTEMLISNKSQQDLMKLYEDGNDNVTFTLPKINSFLGIGTSNFVDGTDTYRLSVKGKIRAEEIKVYNTWADYVFKKEYKLPTLHEVENYIAQNGHLQNVPSAKEVTEKGLKLGEMAKIQQEKIEELMLYIIAQNKRIEALEKKIND